MHRHKKIFCLAWIGLFGLAMFAACPALADVTAEPGYQAQNGFAELDTAAFPWHGSTAWYDGYLIYIDDVGKIMAYDTTTHETRSVCNNTFLLIGDDFASAGFMVTKEGYLYFHDNSVSNQILYRINLAWDWPTSYESFNTSCDGDIFSLAQNPWTGEVWFASYATVTDWVYLYEVNAAFSAANKRMSFAKNHGGDNGPIIWVTPDTLLLGEPVDNTEGYFHLAKPESNTLTYNEVALTGGPAEAVYAWNNEIYATTGSGREIYKVEENAITLVAQTTNNAQGLAFDGTNLFISEISNTGVVSFSALTCITLTERLTVESPYTSMALDDLNPADSLYVLQHSLPGFLYTIDEYLFYLDSPGPGTTIFVEDLLDGSVISAETSCDGNIFSFTVNPWTGQKYFASADPDGSGDNMYLYNLEFDSPVITATKVLTMTKFHGGLSGPIIFKNSETLLYGEQTDGGNGYFHKVDIVAKTVISDCMEFDGGLAAATYGTGFEIFVATDEGNEIYSLANQSKTLVATTLAGSAAGLCFDGYSIIVMQKSYSKAAGEITFDILWTPQQQGVLAVDATTSDKVSSSAEFIIKTANNAGAIGLQGNINTFIEFLEVMSADDINNHENMPIFMPFGLINFRAKGDAPGFTATVKVHFSGSFPDDTTWWKYDDINGWYQYEFATFSDDGLSVTLEILDGSKGDADGIVNGYVSDPGGPAFPERHSGVKDYPGWTSDCFVNATNRHVPGFLPISAAWPLLAVFLIGVLIFARTTVKHEP